MTNEDSNRRAIAQAQALYMDASDTGDRETWAEYEATVDMLSMTLGVPLADAYELVENGPVIYL